MTGKKQYQALESKLNKFVTSLSPARHYSLSCSKLDQFIFKSLIHVPSNTTVLVKGSNHGITKYGIHSLMQRMLAMDKELTNWQDSAPDWLSKSSRQLVICIYRQRTYYHSWVKLLIGCTNRND